jgi:hypothetical protein
MRKERRSNKPWNTTDPAYLGAFLGMSIAGVHVFLHISRGELPSQGAFLHILLDLLARTVGVASLFASVSGLRNWLART